jgi:hypothetical protein
VLDDLVDELDEVVDDDSVFVLVDELEPESDESFELELDSDAPLLDSDAPLLDSDALLLEESLVEPAGVVVEVLPRLSFLKNPLPLNVTPTG